MRVPDLEEMVSAMEHEVSVTLPRNEQMELLRLMLSNHETNGTLPTGEFARLLGLALNADDGGTLTEEQREHRRVMTQSRLLSYYPVTEEDARLACDRDKKDHLRWEGLIAALDTEVARPGDWTDRSE